MAKLESTIVEIAELPRDSRLVTISWNLSSVCNYRCSYCDEEYNGGKQGFPRLEDLFGFLQALDRSFADRQVIFELKGGEPTLWKDLPDFARFVRDRNWLTILVSNGSRSLKWWRQNVRLLDNICLSFHPEFTTVKHLSDVLEIVSGEAAASVLVLMWPDLFEEAAAAVLEFRLRFPFMSVTPIQVASSLGDGSLVRYSESQRERLAALSKYVREPRQGVPLRNDVRGGRNIGVVRYGNGLQKDSGSEELKLKNHNRFSGWECSAGLSRLHIESDGKVFRGQCRVGKSIGSIYDSTIAFPIQPVICDKSICFCGGEILLPKRMLEYETPSDAAVLTPFNRRFWRRIKGSITDFGRRSIR